MEEKSFEEMLVENMRKPDPNPFLYVAGQTGRVKKGVSNDGQTPEYWDGAKVEILSQHRTIFLREHIYKVRHLVNNITCEFKEYKLDRRFSRQVVF